MAMAFGAVYARDSHKHSGKHSSPGQAVSVQEGPGICPVMKGKAKKEYSVTYKGKTYYLCCPECMDEFRKNPEKFVSRIKEFKIESFHYGYTPDVIKVNQGDNVKLIVTSPDGKNRVEIKD
ncbi:MAG: YHS domain-containing protein, partial [Endomicrobiales bacterium]